VIVVPAIDLQDGRVVRLVEGEPGRATVYEADPVAVARWFEAQGAPLLHVVDLDAALGTGSNARAVRAVCRAVGAPVQVGGGLRTLESVDEALRSGAARAVLGTAAASDPSFVSRCVARHGDRIVVAVDVREGRVVVRGWREEAGALEELLPALDAAGTPRYLVTAVTADGRLEGPDLALYQRVRSLTGRPVLASGGVRDTADLRALAALGVEGAVVGRALYEGTLSLPEVGAVGGRL
jgi:phosphoribosylformimino-5-aminoimidazole carboxamide ribotide isomerase